MENFKARDQVFREIKEIGDKYGIDEGIVFFKYKDSIHFAQHSSVAFLSLVFFKLLKVILRKI